MTSPQEGIRKRIVTNAHGDFNDGPQEKQTTGTGVHAPSRTGLGRNTCHG